MAGINEYLEACRYRKNFLTQQMQWLLAEKQAYEQDALQLEETLKRVRQEAVGYLVPEVQEEYLKALEDRLSYPGLMPIKRKFDVLFEKSEARRLELEAMDEIVHHEFQLNQAQRLVEELQPIYDKLRRQVSEWEDNKWFHRLKKRGYFETDYQQKWYHWFFNWRDVSFLMSRLSNLAGMRFPTPLELRSHYRGVRSEGDDVFAAYDKRAGDRDHIIQLKDEHEETLRAPERLLSELYDELGAAILAHLEACPDDLRLDLAKKDPHLHAFLRKESGLQKQVQYLRELAVTRIESVKQQVDQELHKIDTKINKLEMQRRRGKRKRYSGDEIVRMKNVKADKWGRRREKTERMRQRIVSFDRYDSGSFLRDYLWWDVMTKSAYGDDLYEVREFRRRNPNWRHDTYTNPIIDDSDSVDLDHAAEALYSAMSAPDRDDLVDFS